MFDWLIRTRQKVRKSNGKVYALTVFNYNNLHNLYFSVIVCSFVDMIVLDFYIWPQKVPQSKQNTTTTTTTTTTASKQAKEKKVRDEYTNGWLVCLVAFCRKILLSLAEMKKLTQMSHLSLAEMKKIDPNVTYSQKLKVNLYICIGTFWTNCFYCIMTVTCISNMLFHFCKLWAIKLINYFYNYYFAYLEIAESMINVIYFNCQCLTLTLDW